VKLRVKKNIKLVICMVLIAGALAGLTLWARTPTEGKILTPPPIKGPTTYYDKTLDGTYISFKYSGKYLPKNEGPRDNDMERYTLSADTHYDKRVLVSVAGLPDGRLEESNGSYIFRQKSTDLYGSRKVPVGNTTTDVWVKKDGTEQTTMIPHGDKVAIISFVTANPSDDLTGEMDALLKTFAWKN
jgi:hypothetical protein